MRGSALYFPAPHSYTGEHVLELQGHGGDRVLMTLVQRAARARRPLARPGEFTSAPSSTTSSISRRRRRSPTSSMRARAAARAAMRSLEGEFSARIAELRRRSELRTYVEAAIDFPEEEIDFLSAPARRGFQAVREHFDAIVPAARQGGCCAKA